MFGSGIKTSITFNEEVNDIMKIIRSLEESGLLIKGVSETIKNETKEHKGRFLGKLLGTLGKGKIRAGEDTIRAGQNF